MMRLKIDSAIAPEVSMQNAEIAGEPSPGKKALADHPELVNPCAVSRRPRVRRFAPGVLALGAGLRALAALVLLLLAGQHTLPGLHHALEAHEVCAEHGELIHAGHGEAPAQRLPLEGRGIARGADHGEHGHCPVLLALQHQELALLPAGFVGLAEPCSKAEPALAALVLARPTDALFRLAPKQSPPA
jgi:hypothetical protein